jgi:hypothetical protein
LRWLVGLVALLGSGTASAHKPSDAFLALTFAEGTIEGQWDIGLRDLEQAIGLDQDGDGAITWHELANARPAIEAYALARLEVIVEGSVWPLRPSGFLVDEHSDGGYAVLRFEAGVAPAATLDVTYRLFADIDPLHRGLLRIQDGEQVFTAVLGPDAPTFRLRRAIPPGHLAQAGTYLVAGAWHVWRGFDHILFLLALLLPAVLRREAGRWRAVPSFRAAVGEVAGIVTMFTIAHSLTLALATLSIIGLPSRLVEAAVAATILLAALNNLVPLVMRRTWLVAFGFGLIHGFGYASALQALTLPPQAFAISLLAFNLGVELGQLTVIALLLPAAFLFRAAPLYPHVALRAGSGAIGFLATIWLLERAFDLQLIG